MLGIQALELSHELQGNACCVAHVLGANHLGIRVTTVEVETSMFGTRGPDGYLDAVAGGGGRLIDPAGRDVHDLTLPTVTTRPVSHPYRKTGRSTFVLSTVRLQLFPLKVCTDRLPVHPIY